MLASNRAAIPSSLSVGGTLDLSHVPRTLAELVVGASLRHPDRGISFLDAGGAVTKHLTYPALVTEATTILNGLRRCGLRAGDGLFVQLEDNEAILPVFWACVLGGFRPLIAPLAPSYEENNHVLTRLRESHALMGRPRILTRAGLVHAVRRLGAEPLVLENLPSVSGTTAYYAGEPTDTAFYTMSSGSGGKTKCAILTHASLLAGQHGANVYCGHRSEDVIFNWLPFDHIGAITDWHLRPMMLGCDLYYAAKETVVSEPTRWLDILTRYRVTHSWAPNFAYASLLRALDGKHQGRWDLSAMRFLLNIGEPISARLVEELKQVLGHYGLPPHAPRAAWGMTELSGGTVYSAPGATLTHRVERGGQAVELVDLGGPIPGVTIRVVGEESVGRVEVHGPSVFPGYLGDEAATREVLDDGWFNTGDLGFLSGTSLVLTGREKSILIVNGVKYYGADLETAVERVPGVQPSSTAALAVRAAGSNIERLAIFYVPREGAEVGDEIRSVLSREMGVTPDDLLALTAAELPRTQIGKLSRGELTKRYEAGMYQGRTCGTAATDASGLAPLGTIEEALARHWRMILRRDVNRPDADFFKLGGNSLLATQLLGRIRDGFRVKLAMSALFHAPTLRQMAETIVRHEERPGLTVKIAELLVEIDGLRGKAAQ